MVAEVCIVVAVDVTLLGLDIDNHQFRNEFLRFDDVRIDFRKDGIV